MDYAIATLGIVLAVLSIIVPLAAAFYFGLNYGPELLEHLQRR
jgi:hypothetical protein